MQLDGSFAAIACPTRRRILDLLKDGERSVGSLTEALGVSQPAVSQQLAALRDVGLVAERREGRFRFYRLEAEPLADVLAWVKSYERFWTETLDELGRTLDRMKERKEK